MGASTRARERSSSAASAAAAMETMDERANDAPRGVTASERATFAVVAPISR